MREGFRAFSQDKAGFQRFGPGMATDLGLQPWLVSRGTLALNALHATFGDAGRKGKDRGLLSLRWRSGSGDVCPGGATLSGRDEGAIAYKPCVPAMPAAVIFNLSAMISETL